VNAAAIPIAIPTAASATAQPASVAAPTEASTAGQRAASANVTAAENATRAWVGAAETPGIGVNASAPLTRASVSRKPYSVAADNVRLMGIARQVPQYRRSVCHALFEHPRHQQQQAEEKGILQDGLEPLWNENSPRKG